MVFYLDENLHGPRFRSTLTAAGVEVRRGGDLGFSGAPDAEWIPIVVARGWVILRGDLRTRLSLWEKQLIARAGARVIQVVAGDNANHAVLARNFLNTLPAIERLVAREPAPWLVTLTRPTRFADLLARRPGRLYRQRLP
jgi:hypothetical protein